MSVECVLRRTFKKAENKLKNAKKIGVKELQKIKETYNAASAFASIMSLTLQREQIFKNYDEMKKHVADSVVTTIDEDESKTGKNYSDSNEVDANVDTCLLYTSPSPRDLSTSRMPSSA